MKTVDHGNTCIIFATYTNHHTSEMRRAVLDIHYKQYSIVNTQFDLDRSSPYKVSTR